MSTSHRSRGRSPAAYSSSHRSHDRHREGYYKSDHRDRHSTSRHRNRSGSSEHRRRHDSSRRDQHRPRYDNRKISRSRSASPVAFSKPSSSNRPITEKPKQKITVSSSSDDMEPEEIKKLLKDLQQKKVNKKARETVAEKRKRRLAKKLAKETRRKQQMGWDQECLGYTNEDNPFGDRELFEPFLWKKKLIQEGKGHLSKEQLQMEQKQNLSETQRELQAVRQRRQEREKEREQRQQELETAQRDREADYFRGWAQQEDSFHLQQAKLRSRIRIAEGRAKPIDLLSYYITNYETQDEENPEEESVLLTQLHEPTEFLVGLDMEDLEDLLEDIKVVYTQLEKGGNADYWRDITTVATAELQDARQKQETTEEVGATRSHINPSVMNSITQLIKTKNTNELITLEKQVKNKLLQASMGSAVVDVNYWETLQQMVHVQLARCRLRDRHQEFLKLKLQQLKNEQGIGEEEETAEDISGKPFLFPSGAANTPTQSELSPAVGDDNDLEEQNLAPVQHREMYDSGRYSPKLWPSNDDSIPVDAVIYLSEEDKARLVFERMQVSRFGDLSAMNKDDELMRQAQEGMDPEEEAQFSVTVPVVQPSFLWSDKYRPRKPRFFNRVHTGYDWNKYNQTHYDVDNPPPKIVQGYKFNIFYPDLIDTTKTPNYSLIPCDDDPDFAILKFEAGPPYEDIAFKIVNREWDCSYRHGFRCQFQNHVFQLWFKYTRYRYRR